MASRDTESAGDDGINPNKRYYRIGEVSSITKLKPYVWRYWESEFRWMAQQKSRSKQRLYRRRDIDMILLIKKLLYEQRFTIPGARRRLNELLREGRSEASGACAEAAALPAAFGLELREIRDLLANA